MIGRYAEAVIQLEAMLRNCLLPILSCFYFLPFLLPPRKMLFRFGKIVDICLKMYLQFVFFIEKLFVDIFRNSSQKHILLKLDFFGVHRLQPFCYDRLQRNVSSSVRLFVCFCIE